MAAGDFSASVLTKIKLKAENNWQDSRLAEEYKAHADAAVAVLANQTVTIKPLVDRDKDYEVEVVWIDPCNTTLRDCQSACDLQGPLTETKAQPYALTLCKEAAYSVNVETSRTNMYEVEEVAAQQIALRVKELDEWWAQRVLIKLKSFAGINVAPTPWTYNPVTNTTEVPTADYNVKMVSKLLKQAILNKMPNPYFIDNGNLFTEWWDKEIEKGNLDGAGDAARIKAIKLYFDMWNFLPAGLTEDTFMVNKNAVALHTKVKHPDTPKYIGGQVNHTIYTIPSTALPGVKYDVFYTMKCVTVGNFEQYVHTWVIRTKGDVLLNPKGCPVTVSSVVYNPTGVISYSAV